jgi:molybdate transport system regulatory protein
MAVKASGSKLLKKQKKNIVANVRLTIEPKNKEQIGTLGKGVATLLDGVKAKGSLNRAAKDIKMAYSKAWRIVKETEQGLGFDLISRDGARGSTLTPEGDELLTIYNKILAGASDYVTKQFDKLV